MSEVDHSAEDSEENSQETDDISEDETQPVNSETETEIEKTDDEEEGEETDEEETLIDPQTQVFKVAGKEFKSLKEAIAHVSRIAGDNSRLYGELKKLSDQVEDYKLQRDEALEANQSWQKYYEGKGDMPSQDLKRVVREILSETESSKSKAELDKQYKSEWAEIRSKPNLSSVLPIMEDLMKRIGKDVNKLSPKEIYKMAKGILNEEPLNADEIIRDTENKTLAKQKARKILGGNKVAPSSNEESKEDLSPEISQYVSGFMN